MAFKAGNLTVRAGENLVENTRVKIKPGTTVYPPEVVYADLGEPHLGITLNSVAKDELVAVRPRNMPGSIECLAAAPFNPGDLLYGAADGRFSPVESGPVLAIAFQGAGALDDVVEVVETTFYIHPLEEGGGA